MQTTHILKTVLVGNLVMNTPFILAIAYVLFFRSLVDQIGTLFLILALGAIYWSFMSSWYRRYSIEKLDSKKEFMLWKKWSVNSLLLWPDNFILNKMEFWNDESLRITLRK